MKVSGHVLSTKPISVSRAAKLISRFAAVENGSSPAVSLYLQRTSDAFNHLVQFHDKRSKPQTLDESQSQKKIINNLDGDGDKDGAKKKKKKKKRERERESGEAEKSSRKKSRADSLN